MLLKEPLPEVPVAQARGREQACPCVRLRVKERDRLRVCLFVRVRGIDKNANNSVQDM
jgi:hypothetical protein